MMNAAMFDESFFPVVVVGCVLIGIAYIFLKEWLYGLDEITDFKAYAGEVETIVNDVTPEPEEIVQPVKSVNRSSFARYVEDVMYIVNDGVIL